MKYFWGMDRMACHEMNAYRVEKHSKPTPRLAHVTYLFIIWFMKWHIELREGFSFRIYRALLEYQISSIALARAIAPAEHHG